MCFMCFCVFPQRSQVTPPMCSVCFCILLTTFSSNLVQTGATIPYVLCVSVFFFPQIPGHNTHVFCVFLCFFTNAKFDPSLDRGTHPMCFMCFCVFSTGHTTHVFCVFCVFSQVSGHTTHVFCVFLCFFTNI